METLITSLLAAAFPVLAALSPAPAPRVYTRAEVERALTSAWYAGYSAGCSPRMLDPGSSPRTNVDLILARLDAEGEARLPEVPE